jgi:hypothetical protein
MIRHPPTYYRRIPLSGSIFSEYLLLYHCESLDWTTRHWGPYDCDLVYEFLTELTAAIAARHSSAEKVKNMISALWFTTSRLDYLTTSSGDTYRTWSTSKNRRQGKKFSMKHGDGWPHEAKWWNYQNNQICFEACGILHRKRRSSFSTLCKVM